MHKNLIRLFSLMLALLLLVGCRAYTLTDYLPDLIDRSTQLPGITSIAVKRLSDDAEVLLTDAADLNKMMLHVEGIQGSRSEETLERFAGTYPPQYEITFCETDKAITLVVCGDEEFYMAGYAWLAVRGGMDLFYLDSLFAEALTNS